MGSEDGPIKNPPKYFSGTNCKVWGLGKANDPPAPWPELFLTRQILKLNGETVFDKSYNEEDFREEIAATITFDSTHFADGSNVTVEYSVTDNFNRTYTDTATVPVKNQAMCAQAGDYRSIPGGAGDVDFITRFGLTNYTTSKMIHLWNSNDYFSMMRGKNVVVFNGHGTHSSHFASDSLTVGSGEEIFPYSYSPPLGGYIQGYDQRFDHMGEDAPPYNTTEVPPVNLMWHYACNTGHQPGFVRVLWPFISQFDPPLTNQATVTFKHWVLIAECRSITNELCRLLLQSDETVGRAIQLMSGNVALPAFIMESPTSFPRRMQEDDVLLKGDQFTRISGVYTHSNDKHTTWFRQS